MATHIWVNIGSGNGLVPDDTKPPPGTMLSYHQMCTMAYTEEVHYKKRSWTLYVTCVCKLYFRTDHHIFLGQSVNFYIGTFLLVWKYFDRFVDVGYLRYHDAHVTSLQWWQPQSSFAKIISLSVGTLLISRDTFTKWINFNPSIAH